MEINYVEKPQTTPLSPYFDDKKGSEPVGGKTQTPAEASDPLLEHENTAYVIPASGS